MQSINQYIPHKHILAPIKFHSGVICNICFRQGGPDQTGISCPSCNIDLCEACYYQLKCAHNRHCHKLYLSLGDFTCNLCKRKFKDNQGTRRYCQKCDYYECMECSIKM